MLFSILTAATAMTLMQSPTEESLIEFADRFDQAQLAKDGEALERMVADELVFIEGSGKRLGKGEFIRGWTGAGDTFHPITLTDRVVVQLSDAAGIVSAETVLRGTSDGTPFSSRLRFSDTFRREGRTWKAVHIQVTPMPDEAPR